MITSPCRLGSTASSLPTLWASCGWDHLWSQRATLAASFGSVVRAMRQAHRLLHGTRTRAPRLDHYN